jgi:hypothetical protein
VTNVYYRELVTGPNMPLTRHLYELDEVTSALQTCLRKGWPRAHYWLWELLQSDEHDVVYYQECPDVESMAIVENMVFQRLKKHREQANRERFILPKGEHIDLFRDVVKDTIEFVMK